MKREIIRQSGMDRIESIPLNQTIFVCYLLPGFLANPPFPLFPLIQTLLRHYSTQVQSTLLSQLTPVYEQLPAKELLFETVKNEAISEIERSESENEALIDSFLVLLTEFAPNFLIPSSFVSSMIQSFPLWKSRLQLHSIQLWKACPLHSITAFSDRVLELLPYALSRDSYIVSEFLSLLDAWSSVLSISQIVRICEILCEEQRDPLFFQLLFSFLKRAVREEWNEPIIIDALAHIISVATSESLHALLPFLSSIEKRPSWRDDDLTKLADMAEEIAERENVCLSYLDSVLLEEVSILFILNCR